MQWYWIVQVIRGLWAPILSERALWRRAMIQKLTIACHCGYCRKQPLPVFFAVISPLIQLGVLARKLLPHHGNNRAHGTECGNNESVVERHVYFFFGVMASISEAAISCLHNAIAPS